jgi:hypothetical protein
MSADQGRLRRIGAGHWIGRLIALGKAGALD